MITINERQLAAIIGKELTSTDTLFWNPDDLPKALIALRALLTLNPDHSYFINGQVMPHWLYLGIAGVVTASSCNSINDKTELARKAIKWYLANHEKEVHNERETEIAKSLKSIEDRLAGILVKVGMEVCSMNHLFWTRTDPEVRKELFQKCWEAGVKRMQRKLRDDEEQLRDKMRTQKK